AGVRHAEQALALAGELGLPRSARTVGYLGLARCDLGDAAGLDDFREAIVLATEAGQGHDAGLIYGNLGETLWAFEGALPALELMRSGIAFARDRGLAEAVSAITGGMLDPLFGHGDFDEALEVAAAIMNRSETDMTATVNAVIGLTAAAVARAALGQNAAAAALLAEVLATPGARAIQYYGICLPTM